MTLIIGCKDNTESISPEEIQKEKLAKTWLLVSAILDNETVTDEFLNFELTINNDFNYSTNSENVERQPNPWPSGGHFTFAINGDGTINLNSISRDEELDMTINTTESTLSISFGFDKNLHSGSREEAVDGDWVFEFQIQ